MEPRFRVLRGRQLERSLAPFLAARNVKRPVRGWLRALREASGFTVRELAGKMGSSPQLPLQLERSEADYRITLRSLQSAADALGCDLVYALVPRKGSVLDIDSGRREGAAARLVHSVEHTMALEDQAVGGVKQKIAEETDKAK